MTMTMTMTMTIIISNDDLGVGMRFFSLFVFRRESRNKQTFGVKCDLLGQSQIVSTHLERSRFHFPECFWEDPWRVPEVPRVLPNRFPVEAQLQRSAPVEDLKLSKLDITNFT